MTQQSFSFIIIAMNNINDLIIDQKDFTRLSELKILIVEKKPGNIIFDFTNHDDITSSYINFILQIIKENRDQQINSKIIFKNPNHLIKIILDQTNILDFGEVISE